MSRPVTFSHFWPKKLVITPATSERPFLFQRVSVLVQRFNGVLLHDSFVFVRTARSNGHSDNFLLIFSKPLGILDTEGKKKQKIIIIIIQPICF